MTKKDAASIRPIAILADVPGQHPSYAAAQVLSCLTAAPIARISGYSTLTTSPPLGCSEDATVIVSCLSNTIAVRQVPRLRRAGLRGSVVVFSNQQSERAKDLLRFLSPPESHVILPVPVRLDDLISAYTSLVPLGPRQAMQLRNQINAPVRRLREIERMLDGVSGSAGPPELSELRESVLNWLAGARLASHTPVKELGAARLDEYIIACLGELLDMNQLPSARVIGRLRTALRCFCEAVLQSGEFCSLGEGGITP